jgi:hypothetical protein
MHVQAGAVQWAKESFALVDAGDANGIDDRVGPAAILTSADEPAAAGTVGLPCTKDQVFVGLAPVFA